MEESKYVVTVRFGRRELVALAALALVAVFPGQLSTEQLTMTTYYPSPYGVYSEMRSQNSAFLAYNGGQLGVGTSAVAPNVKLNVVGNMGVSGYGLIDNLSVGHTASPAARIDVRNGNLMFADGMATLKSDQGGSIELGGPGGGASGSPYIDFHYLGSGADYSARIINYNTGLFIHGGSGGDLSGYLGNSCRMIPYAFGVNTYCPANWSVYSYANTSGIMFNAPNGGAMESLPLAGQMLCCKLQPF